MWAFVMALSWKNTLKKGVFVIQYFCMFLGKSYSTTMTLYAFETLSNAIVKPINSEILSKRIQRVDRRSRVECAPLTKWPVVRLFEALSIFFACITEAFQHHLVDASLDICVALSEREVWIYVVRTLPGSFKWSEMISFALLKTLAYRNRSLRV